MVKSTNWRVICPKQKLSWSRNRRNKSFCWRNKTSCKMNSNRSKIRATRQRLVSYEKTINKLQADLKKAENKKSTEMEKLRARFVEMRENNAEISTEYETLKQVVWFSVIKWQTLGTELPTWRCDNAGLRGKVPYSLSQIQFWIFVTKFPIVLPILFHLPNCKNCARKLNSIYYTNIVYILRLISFTPLIRGQPYY